MGKRGSDEEAQVNKHLQGTWRITKEEYSDNIPKYCFQEDGEEQIQATWKFTRGKAVYTDYSTALTVDYRYKIDHGILTLYTTEDKDPQPEQYHVHTDGKRAVFYTAENGGENYITRIEMEKM